MHIYIHENKNVTILAGLPNQSKFNQVAGPFICCPVSVIGDIGMPVDKKKKPSNIKYC